MKTEFKKIRYIILLLILTTVSNSYAQYYYEYENGDTLFVRAISSLNIREKPQLDSKIITRIPYGDFVIVKNKNIPYKEITIELIKSKLPNGKQIITCDISGKMIKIKYKDIEGYVFDGYLSKIKPIKLGAIDLSKELETQFGILKKIENNIPKGRNDVEIIYNNGYIETQISYESSYETVYCLSNFKFEEAVLIVSNYYDFYKEKDFEDLWYIESFENNLENAKIVLSNEMQFIIVSRVQNMIIIQIGAAG